MSFPDPARSSSPFIRPYTAAEWTAADYHLLAGELGIETDSGKQKVGIGLRWSQTPYQPLPGEAPSNGTTYGRKDGAWVDITAPANLQVNRGTATEVAAYTPLSGEPVWDETNKRLIVGDGATQGGVPIGLSIGSYSTTTVNLSDSGLNVTLFGDGSVWSFEFQAVIGGDFRDYSAPYAIVIAASQFWALGTTNTQVIDGAYFGVLQYHSGGTLYTGGLSSETDAGTAAGAPTSGVYSGPTGLTHYVPPGDGRLAYVRASGTIVINRTLLGFANAGNAPFSIDMGLVNLDDGDDIVDVIGGCLQRSLVCRRVG